MLDEFQPDAHTNLNSHPFQIKIAVWNIYFSHERYRSRYLIYTYNNIMVMMVYCNTLIILHVNNDFESVKWLDM